MQKRRWARGGANRERAREKESAGRGEGGGVQLIRVDGRCVRFKPSPLPLIRAAEGGRLGNDLKRKSRICYRRAVLYNLLHSSALVPLFSCFCRPCEPLQENTTRPTPQSPNRRNVSRGGSSLSPSAFLSLDTLSHSIIY